MSLTAIVQMDETKQAQCREACQRFRVMISGSAALPDTVLERWVRIGVWALLPTLYDISCSGPLRDIRSWSDTG